MKTIKILRITHAIFWAAALVFILVMVVSTWRANCCDTRSIVLAVVLYTSGCSGLWFIGDDHLRDQLKRYK